MKRQVPFGLSANIKISGWALQSGKICQVITILLAVAFLIIGFIFSSIPTTARKHKPIWATGFLFRRSGLLKRLPKAVAHIPPTGM